MKKTINDIFSAKHQMPLVCLTSYTAPMTKLLDPHCDLLLVGDSVAMVLYGEVNTQSASLEMMIAHGRAVMKSAKRALVVVDMPFGSYEHDKQDALMNAQRIMDETGCDALKLEGGEVMADIVHLLTQNDIPVMGHIGLLPQSVTTADGFKVQGRDDEDAQQIMKDAKAISQAGAFCVVVEAVPEPLAAAITGAIQVPTIGIGASAACDGQILVVDDMLGLTDDRVPRFVKQYAALHDQISKAVTLYKHEVQTREFPKAENTYQVKTKTAA